MPSGRSAPGWASIDAVGRLDVKSAKLQARIGIATGLVVVGDLIGEGSAQEQAVVGETPNLAARLQALAAPAQSGDCRQHAATDRRSCSIWKTSDRNNLPASPSRNAPGGSLGESGRGKPVRGVALGRDAARRARGGGRAASPPLATGEDRRRTGGADLRRAGHRQVAADGCAFRAHRNRAAYPLALFLLAAPPGQRALSVHRPARTRRRVHPRRHGRSEARQAAGAARAGLAG